MALFSKKKKEEENKEVKSPTLDNNVEKREIKKWFELNIFRKTYQYVWVVLPLTMISFVCLAGYMWIDYYLKTSQLAKLEQINKTYISNVDSDNKGFISVLSWYNKTLEQYKRFTETSVNYNTLFNTLENYIPKDMERSNLRIKLNDGWKLRVNLSGKVTDYKAYIGLLSVVDKCNFTDPAEKDRLLQFTRVEFSEDGNSISDAKAVNMQFDFDLNQNQILKEVYYKEMNKKFERQWNYLHLQWVIDGTKQDVWSETGINYLESLDNIVKSKKDFTTSLAAIANIDENGYHIKDKWENFITEYQTQNKIFDFLIKYYEERRAFVQKRMSSVFDTGEIKYTLRGSEKSIMNIKEMGNERIKEINTLIFQLNILKKYNEYLLDNNQLNTFSVLRTQWGDAAQKIDEIIKNKNIVVENDTTLNGLVSENITDPQAKADAVKAAYVEMVKFAQNADTNKVEFLKVKEKYIDSFYNHYYKDNFISATYQILNAFIGATYNETIFNNIQYQSLNFNATNANANFSYKKRFYLSLKNDTQMSPVMEFIKSEAEFNKNMIVYDDFKQQESDIITYNNSKINCLTRDVRQEKLTVYGDVLKEQNQKLEDEKTSGELNIIIETLKEDQAAVNNTNNNQTQPTQPTNSGTTNQ